MNYETEILFQLRDRPLPMSASWLCGELGIKRGRNGRYSKTAYAKYHAVGVTLQRLKRAGKVEYVKGKGAGWRLASGAAL